MVDSKKSASTSPTSHPLTHQHHKKTVWIVSKRGLWLFIDTHKNIRTRRAPKWHLLAHTHAHTGAPHAVTFVFPVPVAHRRAFDRAHGDISAFAQSEGVCKQAIVTIASHFACWFVCMCVSAVMGYVLSVLLLLCPVLMLLLWPVIDRFIHSDGTCIWLQSGGKFIPRRTVTPFQGLQINIIHLFLSRGSTTLSIQHARGYQYIKCTVGTFIRLKWRCIFEFCAMLTKNSYIWNDLKAAVGRWWLTFESREALLLLPYFWFWSYCLCPFQIPR